MDFLFESLLHRVSFRKENFRKSFLLLALTCGVLVFVPKASWGDIPPPPPPPPGELTVTLEGAGGVDPSPEIRVPEGSMLRLEARASGTNPCGGLLSIVFQKKVGDGPWRNIAYSNTTIPFCCIVPCVFVGTATVGPVPLSDNGAKIRAVASAPDHNTGYSNELTLRVYTRPDKPVLEATPLHEAVRLSWTPIPPDRLDERSGYRFFRASLRESPRFVEHGVVNGEDRPLFNQWTYCYYVVATNKAGDSEPSNIVCATPGPAPRTPTGFQVRSLVNGIGASWDPDPYATNCTVYYTDRYRDYPLSFWNRIQNANNPHMITPLPVGGYYVRVAARNGQGVESAPTEPLFARSKDGSEPPDYPTAPSFRLSVVRGASVDFFFPARSEEGAADEITFTMPRQSVVSEKTVPGEPLRHMLTPTDAIFGRTDTFTYRARFRHSWVGDADVTVFFNESLKITHPGGPYVGLYTPGEVWAKFIVEGGTPPYSFRVAEGSSLPDGLTLNPQTGVVKGRLRWAGAYFLPIQVVDQGGAAATGSFRADVTTTGPKITTDMLRPAAVGRAYSASLTVAGGRPGYTWDLLDPSALSPLSLSRDGRITGVPDRVGSKTFVARVKDAQGVYSAKKFTLHVNALSILTEQSEVHTGSLFFDYEPQVQFRATVAAEWKLLPPSRLPPGMLFSRDGILSGRPAEVGTFPLRVEARSGGEVDWKDYSLVIDRSLLSITTPSPLPPARAGEPYSARIEAQGGVRPYEWSIVYPPPPTTFNIDNDGRLRADAPSGWGEATVEVQVRDSYPVLRQTATKRFVISVLPEILRIASDSLPNGKLGKPYNHPLQATGGKGRYTWSATGLPQGLTIHQYTGEITGTPVQSGARTVTVRVTDSPGPDQQTATKTFPLTIGRDTLTITTESPLLPAYVGLPYNFALTATGGIGRYEWSLPVKPPWLNIDSTTGYLSGTPLTIGTYNITARVTDPHSPEPQIATKEFSLAVTASPLRIRTTVLRNGYVGAYTATVEAIGGVPPYNYTWSLLEQCGGLSIDQSGRITGSPSRTGPCDLRVKVETQNPYQSDEKRFSPIIYLPLVMNRPSLPIGIAGVPYEFTIGATGGMPSLVWSATGLPPGLEMDRLTSRIHGTPPGPTRLYTVQVEVRDANDPPLRLSYPFVLSIVSAADLPNITTRCLPTAYVQKPYSFTVAATGGTPPYHNWSAVGLPEGLTIDPATGRISGTPGSIHYRRTYDVRLQVYDSSPQPRTTTLTLPLDITSEEGVHITTCRFLPDAVFGEPYEFQLEAKGGRGLPYQWRPWGAGALPPGFSLDINGKIRCSRVDEMGTYSFGVMVINSSGSDERTFAISLIPPIQVRMRRPQFPDPKVLKPYTGPALEAIGGKPPYQYHIVEGRVPDNFRMDPRSGVLSGTATAQDFARDMAHRERNGGRPGYRPLYEFKVRVRDADQKKDFRWFAFSHIGVDCGNLMSITGLPQDLRLFRGQTYIARLDSHSLYPPVSWFFAKIFPEQFYGLGHLPSAVREAEIRLPFLDDQIGWNKLLLLAQDSTQDGHCPNGRLSIGILTYEVVTQPGGGSGGAPGPGDGNGDGGGSAPGGAAGDSGGGCRMEGDKMVINLGSNHRNISRIEIRSLQRILVKTIETGGAAEVFWDGTNEQGSRVAHGPYMVHPNAGEPFGIVYPCR